MKRNPTTEFVEAGLQPGSEFQVAPLPDELIFKPVQRVAIFAEAFLPKIDGVSKTAVLVVRHLQQSGREVIIFAPDNDGNTPQYIGPSRVVSMPSLGMPHVPETKIGIPSPLVERHLDAFQPDLIHLFSPATLSTAGVWYGQTRNLPVLANYQTDLPGYANQYGLDIFSNSIRFGLRTLHNSSHLTLAPTHTVIRQLKAWGFERLRLWGRGIDTERFNPSRRTDAMRKRLLAGRPDDSLLMLYVGRLATEKRVELLHEAAALDGVALTIIGDGERRPALEAYFGDDAHFMGYMFGDELAEAYASADLFTFTGTNETFGQVVTEAMASGLPVLVPNAGGVVDLVLDGMNGYICQESPSDFRSKVAWLRSRPGELERMGRLALMYAQSRPWTRLMEQLEGYYAETWDIHKRMQSSAFSIDLRRILPERSTERRRTPDET